jgi:hypothetical protein
MGQSETVTQNAGIGGTLNWVTMGRRRKKGNKEWSNKLN